jgi:long-chain-fatty-acid--CoA ligase ACSBG
LSLINHSSPEWFLSEMGAMMAGGKAAGVYPSDTPDQLKFKVKHSDASVALCEGENELEKFKGVIDDIPYLKAIVVWAYDKGQGTIKRSDGTKVRVVTFKQLMAKGGHSSDHGLNKRTNRMKASHCCCLVYTSGTTGDPKAVMLSHDNIVFEATSVLSHMPFVARDAEQERILSYLPLSHVAGMLVDIVFGVIATATRAGWVTTYYARPYDLKAGTLKSRLQCVRPTIFLGVVSADGSLLLLLLLVLWMLLLLLLCLLFFVVVDDDVCLLLFLFLIGRLALT